MKSKPTKLGRSRIEKYYQYVVIVFIVLTLIIVGLIVYFSFSKTIVSITPLSKDLASIFRVSIIPDNTETEYTLDTIYGEIISLDLESSQTFNYLTDQTEVPAKATGTVIIYNNYSQSQPLVEQTRLLSESGVLFRTTKTITVPAGGQAEVNVQADEAGATGNLLPTNFTIVALWPGLQDKIYAESNEAMTGGLKTATTLTAENYTQAEAELITSMEKKRKLNYYLICK